MSVVVVMSTDNYYDNENNAKIILKETAYFILKDAILRGVASLFDHIVNTY